MSTQRATDITPMPSLLSCSQFMPAILPSCGTAQAMSLKEKPDVAAIHRTKVSARCREVQSSGAVNSLTCDRLH